MNRTLCRCTGFLVTPRLTQQERNEIVDFCIVGVQLGRTGERFERLRLLSAIVQHLTQVKMSHGAFRLQLHRLLEPFGGGVEVTALLLRQSELRDRRYVVRPVGQQLRELRDGRLVLSQRCVSATQLPPRIPLFWILPQPFPQFCDLAVVVSRLGVRNLEIALGHRHLGIQFERDAKSLDSVFDQSFLEIEYAKVVVSPGIGGIDTTGEGTKDVILSFHGLLIHIQPSVDANGVKDGFQ